MKPKYLKLGKIYYLADTQSYWLCCRSGMCLLWINKGPKAAHIEEFGWIFDENTPYKKGLYTVNYSGDFVNHLTQVCDSLDEFKAQYL